MYRRARLHGGNDVTGVDRTLEGIGRYDFGDLGDLIDKTLAETAWNLGRNTKKGLPRLKSIGDHSAHNRRYNAVRDDIDKVSTDFRVVCEDLLYISKLKR